MITTLLKPQQKIIKEIHDSFDNAQEHLLAESLSIIGKCENKDFDKAERLQKLGFVNSETVTKTEKERQQILKSREDAELVQYYKQEYPFLKFLKEEQLEAICKKYNLVFAPVEHYLKDVPEKNIKEIENAKVLKKSDIFSGISILEIESFWSNVPYDLKDILKNGLKIPTKLKDLNITDSDVINFAKKYGGYSGDYNGYVFNSIKIHEDLKDGLFICAPKSHFDLKGLRQNNLGFFNFKTIEVKDPIVFRYCRGGIQVLSKWGLEANDAELANEILN